MTLDTLTPQLLNTTIRTHLAQHLLWTVHLPYEAPACHCLDMEEAVDKEAHCLPTTAGYWQGYWKATRLLSRFREAD